MKFCSLYSGSTGNWLFVSSEKAKILIDAGVSVKKIEQALISLGENISDINAILVTHEHSDHIKSIGSISKKYNIPVYANEETWAAMPEQLNKINLLNKKTFIPNTSFDIIDLKISPFNIPHDAANPCGFNIANCKSKMSIATDLGYVDDKIFSNLKNSSFIMLESNYDPEVLKISSYPYKLKTRIAGPSGHLSNQTAGKTISALYQTGLKEVMLGHLSKENNFPELAYQTVLNELLENKISEKDIKLNVASRNEPSKIILI